MLDILRPMALNNIKGWHLAKRGLSARLVSVLVLSVTLTGSTMSQAAESASAAPAPIMWGAWVGNKPLDSSDLDAFQQRAGRAPSILHWGSPWIHNKSYVPFANKDFDSIRNRGAIPMLDWFSWDYSNGTNQPDFQLANITRGAHDAYITQWAQAAKAWGHPFFLRFNAEMNGWWLPWSEQVNNNQAGDYVAAWRHVVDIFRAQGATNVSWVWCPNIASPKSTPLTGLYPGNDYVDWTCMDGYNWGNTDSTKWQTFGQVFGGSPYNGNHNTYEEILNLAPDKPMMIGETGTSTKGGDAGAWVSDALKTQLPQNFPQIKALVWFNWNDGDSKLDWPIETSPSIQNAFADGLKSGYFTSNDFGGLTAASVGAITPIGGPVVQAPAPEADQAVALDQSGGDEQIAASADDAGVAEMNQAVSDL